jgi:hypothetical protein
MTSRTAVTLTFAVLLAGGLTACGDPAQRGTSAHVKACRAYELLGGADGSALAADLHEQAMTDQSETAPLLVRLKTVRQSAAVAGRTRALGESDYRRYRDVVASTAALEGELNTRHTAFETDEGKIAQFKATADAVDQHCR